MRNIELVERETNGLWKNIVYDGTSATTEFKKYLIYQFKIDKFASLLKFFHYVLMRDLWVLLFSLIIN